MKRIAKWVVIVWSIFSLIGICVGMANVAGDLGAVEGDYETVGSFLGIGCGLGIWLVIWFAIAGPALLVYVVSGKKETAQVEIVTPSVQTRLCTECGKYYEGEPRYCPHCGRPTSSENP